MGDDVALSKGHSDMSGRRRGEAAVTLTEFLLARIAEDEAVAKTAIDPTWSTDESGHWTMIEVPYEGEWPINPSRVEPDGWSEASAPWTEHADRHDPARVLAECEAKRRIVESCQYDNGMHTCADLILPHLAAVYADHPDYESWRP